MDEELLSDILEAEREIRQRNAALEQETNARLAVLAAEMEDAVRQEAARLDEVLAGELECAGQAARDDSAALLAEAHAYAERISFLGAAEVDLLVIRHLEHVFPEQRHDRQDEQA